MFYDDDFVASEIEVVFNDEASIVKSFKTDVGYINLYPTNNEGGWEDYIYTIFPKEGEPTYIAIYKVYTKKCIFVGTPQQLIDKYTLSPFEIKCLVLQYSEDITHFI